MPIYHCHKPVLPHEWPLLLQAKQKLPQAYPPIILLCFSQDFDNDIMAYVQAPRQVLGSNTSSLLATQNAVLILAYKVFSIYTLLKIFSTQCHGISQHRSVMLIPCLFWYCKGTSWNCFYIYTFIFIHFLYLYIYNLFLS